MQRMIGARFPLYFQQDPGSPLYCHLILFGHLQSLNSGLELTLSLWGSSVASAWQCVGSAGRWGDRITGTLSDVKPQRDLFTQRGGQRPRRTCGTERLLVTRDAVRVRVLSMTQESRRTGVGSQGVRAQAGARGSVGTGALILGSLYSWLPGRRPIPLECVRWGTGTRDPSCHHDVEPLASAAGMWGACWLSAQGKGILLISFTLDPGAQELCQFLQRIPPCYEPSCMDLVSYNHIFAGGPWAMISLQGLLVALSVMSQHGIFPAPPRSPAALWVAAERRASLASNSYCA